jgi:hypothetical protein
MTDMCCCSSLGACHRLAAATIAVVLITKHTSTPQGGIVGTQRGAGSRMDKYVYEGSGVALCQFLKGRGTLGWIDRPTFDVLHLRTRIFLWLWALRALSAGWSVDQRDHPVAPPLPVIVVSVPPVGLVASRRQAHRAVYQYSNFP